VDFCLAVLRRLRAGKSPFSADRLHLHHRLLDMGHSHLHAVLIFYSWTALAAIGCLTFMFVPWYWGVTFLVVGCAAATLVTLAPLSRRKRLEADVQSIAVDAGGSDPALAQYDPLDAAARPVDSPPMDDVPSDAVPRSTPLLRSVPSDAPRPAPSKETP
jgi:UDP-GlcNAc:undecaprenyl-phosphate GlcNAc-1-phosphate transferase